MFEVLSSNVKDKYILRNKDTGDSQLFHYYHIVDAALKTRCANLEGISIDEDRRCIKIDADNTFYKRAVPKIKFRIYPNAEQAEWINYNITCCILIWNTQLSRKIKNYEVGRSSPEINTTQYRENYPELKWTDSYSLKCERIKLRKEFNRAVDRKPVVYPKYKAEQDKVKSYTTSNNTTMVYSQQNIRFQAITDDINNTDIYLKIPKAGFIKTPLENFYFGDIEKATIIVDGDEYYAEIEIHTIVKC